jgi:hypothetical protein
MIAYRYRNEDVELSHILISQTDLEHKDKNMIVMHGLLGNKTNWRGICNRPEVTSDLIYILNRSHLKGIAI